MATRTQLTGLFSILLEQTCCIEIDETIWGIAEMLIVLRTWGQSVGTVTAVLLLSLSGAHFYTGASASEALTRVLEPALHARAMDRASRLRRLRSLLLSIGGTIVEERYYNGARPSQQANLKSASKSLLSILVGIAIDRRYVSGVRAPIGQFFPEYFQGVEDSPKRTITIEDLLTMRSGLETTSNRNYGRWVKSRNWVRHVLTRPMLDVPGGRMIYSTGNSHLLSAILTRTTGTTTRNFARRYLAGPLGIRLGPWLRDPQGIYFGGNEMHLTPRAMIEIGQLYLNRGRVGDKQVVSEAWVQQSIEPRTQSRWSGRQYGYGWWISTLGGYTAYYAWGHGGQFIFVVPDLDLVVVTTSSLLPRQNRQERREYRQALYDLLDHDLVPAADRTPMP